MVAADHLPAAVPDWEQIVIMIDRLGKAVGNRRRAGRGEQAVFAIAEQPVVGPVVIGDEQAAAGHELERQVRGMLRHHHHAAE